MTKELHISDIYTNISVSSKLKGNALSKNIKFHFCYAQSL